MPSVSVAQQHLMQAAEHGAQFPLAQHLRATMTHQQLHDFASGSEKGKPQHAPPRRHVIRAALRSVAKARAHGKKTIGDLYGQ